MLVREVWPVQQGGFGERLGPSFFGHFQPVPTLPVGYLPARHERSSSARISNREGVGTGWQVAAWHTAAMPITVTLPPPDNRVGPGLLVGMTSSLIGPMPTGSVWRVTIATDAEFTNVMWQESISWVFNGQDLFLLTHPGISSYAPFPMVGSGATVHVEVELINGSTLHVDDSGVATGIYDPTAGLGIQATMLASTTGGLTVQEHDAVLLAADNTQALLPANAAGGGQVAQGIQQVLGALGNPQLQHKHASVLISGQGSIARGSGAFRSDAMGIEWYWHTIPPGMGLRNGSVAEYFNRIVQFRLIMEDVASALYQHDVVDAYMEGRRYAWGATVPATLEYYVAPGCVVLLYFTTLLPG